VDRIRAYFDDALEPPDTPARAHLTMIVADCANQRRHGIDTRAHRWRRTLD
jgi:hypothetical protein